jgi:hypothetical protein
MTLMRNRWLGRAALLFSAEGDSFGGSGNEANAPSPEAVLFPDDKANTADDFDDDDRDNDFGDTSDGNGDNGTKDDATKGPDDTVPDDGKYSLTMPDGVEVDQELLDAMGSDFKELGLTTRQAQQLADKFIETQSRRGAAQAENWANRVQGWADEARRDRDIGGHKWQGTVSSAQRALSTLGTPALREYLNASGGGNHPELIRIFAKVGSMIREDNPPTGGADGGGRKAETAHLLFPNDAPKGK